VPIKGNDPVKYSTTQVGIFPVQWKDRVATLSPDKGAATSFWFADVPHIQYVLAPMAVHVAYWHGDFGNPRSAECLNVSSRDGEWLFNWTLPAVPEGWGAVRPSAAMGPSTRFVIRP
jgi:lipoprotein-anchoring transpeptidase ErfK/SrfK